MTTDETDTHVRHRKAHILFVNTAGTIGAADVAVLLGTNTAMAKADAGGAASATARAPTFDLLEPEATSYRKQKPVSTAVIHPFSREF